jgi:two-component system nitrogen regulation sensor histidine kinase NtrY
MKKLIDKLGVATLLSLGSIALLLAEQFAAHDALSRITPWAAILLSVLALTLVFLGRQWSLVRAAVIIASSLTLFAGISLVAVHRDAKGIEGLWRKSETQTIVSTLRAVGESVQRLQQFSTAIGDEVSGLVLENRTISAEDSLAFRLEAFRLLETQAKRITDSGRLPPGTEIGIQLINDNGRMAWAGWPQQLFGQDRRFVSSGKNLVYSRQVSLYQILTHIIPVDDGSGGIAATVIVDMPLEVNYRVSNKFLKSSSFADDIVPASAADVRFDYTATTSNLPKAVEMYEEAFAKRERRNNRAEKTAADRAEHQDSVLAYEPFPAIIRPIGEIGGDENTGLNGRALVHSNLGNPLFTVTVFSRPFRYFLDSYQSRYRVLTSSLTLLALFVYFVLSLRLYPRRLAGPLGLVKAIYLVAVFVFLRYWAVWFLPSVIDPRTKLFDPAIYATPILHGLMRSAGDLLLTSIFFVAAIYGVLKITRESIKRQQNSVGKRSTVLFLFKGMVAAAILYGTFELASRFVKSVVINANPRLVGETMRLPESSAVVLHLSTFLMLAGIFLAGMILVWGVYRLGNRRDAVASSVTAAVAILILSVWAGRWDIALLLSLFVLFIIFAPRVVQREDLVSTVLVAFSFVVVVSAAAYVFLNEDYQALKRAFVQERVTELTHPADNWKVFILEDVLEKFSQDNTVRQALSKPYSPNLQRLAFDLWAGSSLSLLGYSSAIHVFDAQDSLVSRFTVEMPYRVRVSEATERLETGSAQEWVVLDLTTSTPRGIVRFYRGIVNIGDFMLATGGVPAHASIGKVVVDIPFFFESLGWAARTGPQTPEVLRNVQEGGIEPRLEETEALLLARLRGTRVLESSSDVLTVGFAFPEAEFEKALGLEWPLLDTAGAPYRYLVEEGDRPGTYLLAGFPVPRTLQHILRWSTILSLYFFFAVSIIVLIILLKSLPFLQSVLPTLTPGRQLGFQQKLLASFLLIALLPSIILGVFSIRLIRDRFVQENQKEALYKAFSAQKSLSNVLLGEMDYLLDQTDPRELVTGSVSRFERWDGSRLVKVFTRSGEPEGGYDAVGTDEEHTESDDATVAARDVGELLGRFSADQVFVDQVDKTPYLAAFSRPFHVVVDNELEEFVLYYARRLDGELLGEIAEQVGADVNVYNRGELIATSREGLLFGGFISSMMDAGAFVKVSLMRVDESLVTERAGRYTYEVAYLPIRSSRIDENAAIGLPLLFTPESYHVEVQKTSSIVLSIFALLAAATMGLGLLLARGIFEPLKGLLEGTKRISRGDLAFKLPSKRRDEIGTVVEAFNEMTDQLSQSQSALEERRRYLEVILANIGTGVISMDAEDRIRAVNDAAARILDESGAELVDSAVAPQFFELLAKRSDDEQRFVSSEVEITMEGRPRTIKYMKTRLSTDTRYMGTVYVFEDLTELISSKKLSAWVEMSRQIAHEIKNPLTPIKLSTQFMVRAHEEKAEDFPTIFRESSETIIRQVEVLRHIASEFSSFGRLQQLQLVTQKVLPQLEEIVAPYRKNLSGVDVCMHCADSRLEAQFDSEAFRKICTNLIENAMEAMPEGGRLDIMCSEKEREGQQQISISFLDTGAGLNDDVRYKLFEPYFSTKTTGTGLGLAICRGLSREMGGDVVVANLEGGQGVEATLYLRAAS